MNTSASRRLSRKSKIAAHARTLNVILLVLVLPFVMTIASVIIEGISKEGTDLGLSITKKITEMMDGSVSVESE